MKKLREKISEAELCRLFIAWAEPQGFVSYAETAGWDLVLVRKSDGLQIGVQAKLKFNAKLICQTIPGDYNVGCTGPDYRAVLLPEDDLDADAACRFMGLVMFRRVRSWVGREWNLGGEFLPMLKEHNAMDRWFEWPTLQRIKLPNFVPDVAAGASCPIQLTIWKEKALRITALMEIKGFVSLEDFHDVGMDHRRWVPMQWAKFEAGKYYRADRLIFDHQHPRVYQEVLAQERERFERRLASAEANEKLPKRKRRR